MAESRGTRICIDADSGSHVNIHLGLAVEVAVVRPNADGSLCVLLGVGLVAQLLDSALVRLLAAVGGQARIGVEPLGALDAVMAAKAREVLDGLGFLEDGEMSGVAEVGLDLVDVPEIVSGREAGRGDVSTSSCASSW